MTQNQVALIPNLTAGSSLISVLTSNTALTLDTSYVYEGFEKVTVSASISSGASTITVSKTASAVDEVTLRYNVIASVVINKKLDVAPLSVSWNILGDPIIFYSNATGSPIIFYASATGNPVNFYRSPIAGLDRFISRSLRVKSSHNEDKEDQPALVVGFTASVTAGALMNKTSGSTDTVGLSYNYTVT